MHTSLDVMLVTSSTIPPNTRIRQHQIPSNISLDSFLDSFPTSRPLTANIPQPFSISNCTPRRYQLRRVIHEYLHHVCYSIGEIGHWVGSLKSSYTGGFCLVAFAWWLTDFIGSLELGTHSLWEYNHR